MAHPFEPTGRRFVASEEVVPGPALQGGSMLSELWGVYKALLPEESLGKSVLGTRPDMVNPGSFTSLANLAESTAGYDDDGRVVNISRGTRQVRAVADGLRPFLGVVTEGELSDSSLAPTLPSGAFRLILVDEAHRPGESPRYQGIHDIQGGQSNFRLASLDSRPEVGPDCE